MTEKSDGQNDTEKSKDQDRWPWWGQFLLAIIALSVACVLLIWLPVEMASRSATDVFTPMIAVFVGLTTMTISGMFLFMTFRIDRGARLEAQNVAGEVAERETKKIVEIEQFKEKVKKAEKEVERAKEEVGLARVKAVIQIKSAQLEAKTRIEKIETDTTNMLKRRAEDVEGQIKEAGREAKGRIAETKAEARTEVKKAGDEARKKIERDMKNEMKNIEDEAVNRTNEQVDRLIADARGKIDEANIEKLLDERIEPVLTRLVGRRGRLFGLRGRNPDS